MNKKFITKITAFTMALGVMCGSVASCGMNETKKNTKDTSKKAAASNETELAKANLATSLKAVPVDLDVEFNYISNLVQIPGTDKIAIAAYVDEAIGIYLTDTSFTEIKKLDVKLSNDGKENCESHITIGAASDGTLCALETITDYGDVKLPDEYDPDFDYQEAEENAEVTYKFLNIDLEGNIIKESELDNLSEYAPSENFNVTTLLSFGKDKFVIDLSPIDGSSTTLLVLDKEGNILGDMDSDGISYVITGGEDAEGRYLIGGYSTMGMKLKYFDTEAMKPLGEELVIDNTSVYNLNTIFKGDGDYAVYVDGMSGIYGIKADGSTDEIINWNDCDLSSSGSNYAISLGNGEYAVYSFTDPSNKGFYRLTARDASELENTKIITIGTLYDDYKVSEMINKFNKEHDDIRLKAVNYEKFYDYDDESQKLNNSASMQLKMDIVAGKAPDMIVTYDRSIISSLAGKGIFTDLYSLMDDELSKDDILDNVLKASETNGKLYSLSPSFYVTSLACKTKYCDKENWTFSDLKEAYEALPEGTEFCEISSNMNVLGYLLSSLDNCIDYSTATCHFDTPEFKEMVEFCAQFPDTKDIIDWENSSDTEMNDFYNDMQTKFKDDRAFLSNLYLSDFRDYKSAKVATFDDDITLVGFPTEDGTGGRLAFASSFAILDSSDAKAECWDFVKDFFTEDAYKESYQFPSSKKAFDKLAENAMKKRTYTDEEGKEHEIDDTQYINGKEIKISPLTEEEKDYIVDYVRNVTAVSTEVSDDVAQILSDCLEAYYKGEKGLDESIDLIQSKISLLISEQS